MAYISDRQRVELIIFPTLAYSIVSCGADDPDSEVAKEAKSHFQAAVVEAVRHMDPKQQRKVANRALRVCEDLIKPFNHEGGRVDKVGLVLYNLMSWTIESGYLVLHDGSAMSKGMDLLLPGLQHAANEVKLNASARKAAAKLLKSLQGQGYFEGVTIQ